MDHGQEGDVMGWNGTEMAGLIPVRFDIIIVGSLFTFRGVEEVIADGEEKAQEEAFNLLRVSLF